MYTSQNMVCISRHAQVCNYSAKHTLLCVCVHTKASDEFLSGQWGRDVFAGSILGFATA